MTESTETGPQQIVRLLTTKLRVITDRQMAREVFWDATRPLRVARTAIRRLEERGLVETTTVMVGPEPTINGPILDWRTGDPLPQFDRIAWQLQSRWTAPPVRTRVIWATTAAKRAHGMSGDGRRPRAKEITHDIGVAQVSFYLRRHAPECAKHWVGEDALRAQGREGDVPDAVIALPGGDRICIDFGGSYDARRLRNMHQNYAQHGRYQIW